MSDRMNRADALDAIADALAARATNTSVAVRSIDPSAHGATDSIAYLRGVQAGYRLAAGIARRAAVDARTTTSLKGRMTVSDDYSLGCSDARRESRPCAGFLARRFARAHRLAGDRRDQAYWLGYARTVRSS